MGVELNQLEAHSINNTGACVLEPIGL